MAATSIDLLREYVKFKQSYYAKGYPKAKATVASPGILVNDVYPVLLRKDVALMAGAFTKWIYADPFRSDTASFRKAQNDFLLYGMPGMKSLATALATMISSPALRDDTALVAFTTMLYTNGVADLAYPYSEQFWGYLKLLAIARGGAGAVLSPFDMAIEALKESMPDVPDFPCIAMHCLLPSWVVPVSLVAGGVWLMMKFKKKDS
jgi:hypothetical protein